MLPSPLVTLVDLKVMVGNFSTSKKSGDLRWASRFGSRVSMVVVSMVISAELLVMSLSSCWTTPVVFPN